MKVTITLDSDEIAEAIEQYVQNKGILPAGDTIDVNLVAGRGQNGPSAVVSSESLNKQSVGGPTKRAEPKKTKEPTPSKEPEPAGKAEPEKQEQAQAPDTEGGPVDDTSLFGSDDTPAGNPVPTEEPTNNATANPFADDNDGPAMSSGATETAPPSDIDSLFG